MRAAAALLCGLSLFASACASSVSVAADYDPGMDFAAWSTFAWVPGLAAPEGLNDLAHRRIVEAVEHGMVEHGFEQVEPGSADIHVSYHVFVKRESMATTLYDGAGWGGRYGWRAGPGFSRTWIDTYDVGTLIVDFAERSTGNLGWRGSASAVLGAADTPEERTARTREAVKALLDQFPPGARPE